MRKALEKSYLSENKYHRKLDCPNLESIAKVFQDGLNNNFDQAKVTIEDSPDLTKRPFELAAQGICGDEKLLDIGGVGHLTPLPSLKKLYDLKNLPDLTNSNGDQLIIGAGAAPYTHKNKNAELIPNLFVKQNQSVNQVSHIAYMVNDKDHKLEPMPENETKIGLLGNLFLSEGKPGKVLKVECKNRKGPDNLITCLRKSLEKSFPEEIIGVGGVFVVTKGKSKVHVMPDFSSCPLETDEDVTEWLKFFNVDPPLKCTSAFINRDPGWELRLEHSHGYNKNGEGGHYHYDIEPEKVEYIGYFNIAKELWRIDPHKEIKP